MRKSTSFVLGFDTVFINAGTYDTDSIKYLFSFFPKYSVRNFVFLFDFDFKTHSLSLQKEKIKNFILRAKSFAPRGIHIYAYFNLQLVSSSTLNKDILKLCANRSIGTLFVTLPPFNPDNYDLYAKDINKLLYDDHIRPIFVEFSKFISLSDQNISQKLLFNKNAVFTFDINFILNPANEMVISEILKRDVSILPTLSNHFSEYAGLEENIKFFIEHFGKKTYNILSFKIEKTISEFF